MKKISKKKESKKTTVILAAITAVMIAVIVITCAKKGVINIPGLTPKGIASETETTVNSISVACTNAAAPSGTDASSVLTYKKINPDNTSAIIPDDAIVEGDDLSGKVIKIDLAGNTILTQSMICDIDTDENFNDTTRKYEVSFVQLPKGLVIGDYIDIRIKNGNSQSDGGQLGITDYVVLAKKEVLELDGTNITIALSEDELLALNAAAVDMAITNSSASNDGTRTTSTIYATTYLSPAQKAAKVTYTNTELTNELKSNQNLQLYMQNLDINGIYQQIMK